MEAEDKEESEPQSTQFGHPFAGYYLPYPDEKYEGLVSTITDEPPVLNWIYVDKETYEVKYGVRAQAQPNIHGPFDCTRQDRRLTLEGWEGFVAVEEEDGLWAVYFDREDNGLKGRVQPGTRVLEIELTRKERRVPKPEPPTPQVEKTSASVIKTPQTSEENGGNSTTQRNPEASTKKISSSPLKSSAPSIQEERANPSFLSYSKENRKIATEDTDQRSPAHENDDEKNKIRSPSSAAEDKRAEATTSVTSTSDRALEEETKVMQSYAKPLPIRTKRLSQTNGFNGMVTPLLNVSCSSPTGDYYRGTMSDTPRSPDEKSGRDNRLSWAGPRGKARASTNVGLSVPNAVSGTRKRRWSNT